MKGGGGGTNQAARNGTRRCEGLWVRMVQGVRVLQAQAGRPSARPRGPRQTMSDNAHLPRRVPARLWHWNTRRSSISSCSPTLSVATTYDCTCGLRRHTPLRSPSSGEPSHEMVGPTSFTLPSSRARNGSAQWSRPCREEGRGNTAFECSHGARAMAWRSNQVNLHRQEYRRRWCCALGCDALHTWSSTAACGRAASARAPAHREA